MSNVIIWGFDHPHFSAAITNLSSGENPLFTIKMWVGDTQKCSGCTHDIWDFYKGNLAFKDRYFGSCKSEIYDKLYQKIYLFMDMFSRHDKIYYQTISDYLHMFNMAVDFFYHVLEEEKIAAVVFVNIPHEGPDLLLYELAHAMNIPTIIFYQSLFPNRVFYLFDINDFGVFQQIRPNCELQRQIHLEPTPRNDWFYMSFKQGPVTRCLRLGRKLWKYCNDERNEVVALMPSLLIKAIKKRRYLRTMHGMFEPLAGINKPYVYFPLHLQPELTTSAIGGIYCDQLLALERLSSRLPPDWQIVVKENPKQTEMMRTSWFFQRLKMIKKVKLAATEVSTYELLEKAQFVATVTGTVGWEAINAGKNVLVFGQAWYLPLPGVFRFSEDFKVDDIMKYQIEFSDLQEKFAELISKTGNAILDSDYFVTVKDFDGSRNNKNVENLLKAIFTTYFPQLVN